MSLTPNRDAAEAAIAIAKRRDATVMAVGDARGLGVRMAFEAGSALTRGVADMLDRGMNLDEAWSAVGNTLARGLASFLLTAGHGDPAAAARLVADATLSIDELARSYLAGGPEGFAIARAEPNLRPKGRA